MEKKIRMSLFIFYLNKLRSELNSNNNYFDNFIYNYFTWIKSKEMTCQNCQGIFKVWQNFPTFDLDIAEFSKYNRSRSKNIKISNCLDIYNFAKNTKSFCKDCGNYQRIITKNKIFYSPNNFIFLLNLKGNEDINFEIEQEINLDEFIEWNCIL